MREKQEKAKLEKQKRIEQVKQELKENPVEKSQDREVVYSIFYQLFPFLSHSSCLFKICLIELLYFFKYLLIFRLV
jgi:hypothetical protein